MTPTLARASRRAALMQRAEEHLGRIWPIPSEESIKQSEGITAQIAAELDRWVHWSENGGDEPDESVIISLENKIQRIGGNANNKQRYALAIQSVAQIIAAYKPRLTRHGIFKVKLGTFDLEGESGCKVTITGLWAELMVNTDTRLPYWLISEERPGPEFRSGYCHPHVKDGLPCMGELANHYKTALNSGRLMDSLDFLEDALGTYNGGSPYFRIEEFNGQTCRCGNVVRRLEPAYSPAGSVRLCVRCRRICRTCGNNTDIHQESCGYCNWPCPTCGTATHVSHRRILGGETGCRNCFRSCPGCEQIRPVDHQWYLLRAIGGGAIRFRCETCAVMYHSQSDYLRQTLNLREHPLRDLEQSALVQLYQTLVVRSETEANNGNHT